MEIEQQEAKGKGVRSMVLIAFLPVVFPGLPVYRPRDGWTVRHI
jgi:hypothetical protein